MYSVYQFSRKCSCSFSTSTFFLVTSETQFRSFKLGCFWNINIFKCFTKRSNFWSDKRKFRFNACTKDFGFVRCCMSLSLIRSAELDSSMAAILTFQTFSSKFNRFYTINGLRIYCKKIWNIQHHFVVKILSFHKFWVIN